MTRNIRRGLYLLIYRGTKALTFNPDEARDERGRWVSGGSTKAKKQNGQTAVNLIKSMGHDAELYHKTGTGVTALYSPQHGKIFINTAANHWGDPVQSMKNSRAKGWLSSDSPDHIIHHEIGHSLYDPPDNFFNSHAQLETIEPQVSKYARRNPKEFVAEVHAGMKAGNTYSAEIMQMFKSYARPRT